MRCVQKRARQTQAEGGAEEQACNGNPSGDTVSRMAVTRTNMPHGRGPNLNCSVINKRVMKSDVNDITV